MRVTIKRLICMVTVAICTMAFSAVAVAMSFSAEIVSADGKMIRTGKIFMTNEKIRTEFDEMVNIVRLDKKLIWMLMPKEKTYMEHAFNPNANQRQVPTSEPTAEPTVDETERIFILRETINGYVSDKYRVNYKNEGSHYIWLSSDPGMLMQVKTAAINGSWWQEYRKISFGEPEPAWFEIPAGYTKIGMPGMFMRPY